MSINTDAMTARDEKNTNRLARLLAYAQGGLALAVTVGVLMAVINSITENTIAPMIMGKGLSISPTVMFLSFIFWMFILGRSGAFIAMPLTFGILLFLHSFEETCILMETVLVRGDQSQNQSKNP